MFPVIQIGSLSVQVPGLILIAGLWLGLIIAERSSSRHGIPGNILYNLAFIFLVCGIIGARLSYIVQYPTAFSTSPTSIVSLNPSLLDLWGGIATGFIGTLIYGSRKRLSTWAILDALTPTFATVGIAVGLANLASGNAFGTSTNVPWGIELWGSHRHPTQIYEVILTSLILVIILYYDRKSTDKPPGVLFLTFAALSSLAHLFQGGFRGDSNLIVGNLRTIQVIAWITLATSLVSLGLIKKKSMIKNQP
ncbi:MAG: prolipoprotein diacylglyceryl transferase [Anaerolineales bacterium]|nr:prolipoprotein diacylglyceryl transferase [Anaerolineales bacterium]